MGSKSRGSAPALGVCVLIQSLHPVRQAEVPISRAGVVETVGARAVLVGNAVVAAP